MNASPLAYEQLLATKFFIPSSSHSLIARPRLTDLLFTASFERNLTLVSAPAGFGKTTLLAAWVHSLSAENLHVAWVSLDEEDNDPVRFWTYVITALDRQRHGHFTSLLTYLLAPETPPLPSVVKTLINTMLDGQETFLLVLDDYHLISEQAVHAWLFYRAGRSAHTGSPTPEVRRSRPKQPSRWACRWMGIRSGPPRPRSASFRAH